MSSVAGVYSPPLAQIGNKREGIFRMLRKFSNASSDDCDGKLPNTMLSIRDGSAGLVLSGRLTQGPK